MADRAQSIAGDLITSTMCARPTAGHYRRNDTVRKTVEFLRKAAAELRDAAIDEPDVAQTLRHMADQCEAEADELSQRFGIEPD